MNQWIIGGLLLLVVVGAMSGGAEVLYQSSTNGSGWQWQVLDKEDQGFFVGIEPEQWRKDTAGLPFQVSSDFDFSQQLPILVYLGECPSGGYAINVDKVVLDGKMVVTVSRRSPKPGEFVTMALTYPNDLVVLPRHLLEGVEKIVFQDPAGVVLARWSLAQVDE